MKNEKIERRSSSFSASGRTIEGYAIVFDTQSELIADRFYEVIKPDAISMAIVDQSDVFATLNHSQDRGILQRRRLGKGSLSLSIDSRGLKYSFELGDTPIQQEVASYIDRGEISQSSFQFTVGDNGDEWEQNSDGTYLRTIRSINYLYDISPVFEPQYSAATATIRSLDELVQEKKKANLEKVQKELLERQNEIDKYHKKLYQMISSL